MELCKDRWNTLFANPPKKVRILSSWLSFDPHKASSLVSGQRYERNNIEPRTSLRTGIDFGTFSVGVPDETAT